MKSKPTSRRRPPSPLRTSSDPRRCDESRRVPSLFLHTRSTALEESTMTATYTFDVFSSLDGYGAARAKWTGYWGKQGPELLDHRLALYGPEQRMVFAANTHRLFARMLASSTEESEVRDPWVTRMWKMPATVVSTTLEEPLDWPDATVVSGDAVDVVARLKEESEVPLRSHGSLSMNRALMAAGLVDRVQVTLFPVITGQTGLDPIFSGCGRLRPRADREPDARRSHPGARLPAHPACHGRRASSQRSSPRSLSGKGRRLAAPPAAPPPGRPAPGQRRRAEPAPVSAPRPVPRAPVASMPTPAGGSTRRPTEPRLAPGDRCRSPRRRSAAQCSSG
jgi:dihydrofolate reductase